jgi:hypothetical protein
MVAAGAGYEMCAKGMLAGMSNETPPERRGWSRGAKLALTAVGLAMFALVAWWIFAASQLKAARDGRSHRDAATDAGP